MSDAPVSSPEEQTHESGQGGSPEAATLPAGSEAGVADAPKDLPAPEGPEIPLPESPDPQVQPPPTPPVAESGSADPDENPLETEAEIAADYLEELLDIADLDGDIDTYIEGDRAHVSIVRGSAALVGESGQVLDALQELTRLAVMTETGERSRLMLDVAGYREKRRRQLESLAGEAIATVRRQAGRVALDPMNPFERKVVHDTVAAAGLVSESEGEEPRRHVVVLPAG